VLSHLAPLFNGGMCACHPVSKSIFATAPEPADCYQRMDLVTFGKYATRVFNESGRQ
jgi:hypothetical protein